MQPVIITLTSDFSTGHFVGIMKGVILGICPTARLVDLSHHIPRQDVRSGALVLEQAMGIFPQGTVHLAVVDPGVGSHRRSICLSAAGCLWVGPDNGLFTPMLRADPKARVFAIQRTDLMRQPMSDTFHGRDVFAPVAAHLAAGFPPSELGAAVSDPVLLAWPQPQVEEDRLLGAVLGADIFGNLMTNLTREILNDFLQGAPASIRLGKISLEGVSAAYAHAPSGALVAVYNSLDRLELAINRGDLLGSMGFSPEQAFGLEVVVERPKTG